MAALQDQACHLTHWLLLPLLWIRRCRRTHCSTHSISDCCSASKSIGGKHSTAPSTNTAQHQAQALSTKISIKRAANLDVFSKLVMLPQFRCGLVLSHGQSVSQSIRQGMGQSIRQGMGQVLCQAVHGSINQCKGLRLSTSVAQAISSARPLLRGASNTGGKFANFSQTINPDRAHHQLAGPRHNISCGGHNTPSAGGAQCWSHTDGLFRVTEYLLHLGAHGLIRTFCKDCLGDLQSHTIKQPQTHPSSNHRPTHQAATDPPITKV